jgi:hypothetical protein
MASLRKIHKLMNDRRRVLLSDGRTGKIVRVDTVFPGNDTIVVVWTENMQGPGLAKAEKFPLKDVVGEAPAKSA